MGNNFRCFFSFCAKEKKLNHLIVKSVPTCFFGFLNAGQINFCSILGNTIKGIGFKYVLISIYSLFWVIQFLNSCNIPHYDIFVKNSIELFSNLRPMHQPFFKILSNIIHNYF